MVKDYFAKIAPHRRRINPQYKTVTLKPRDRFKALKMCALSDRTCVPGRTPALSRGPSRDHIRALNHSIRPIYDVIPDQSFSLSEKLRPGTQVEVVLACAEQSCEKYPTMKEAKTRSAGERPNA